MIDADSLTDSLARHCSATLGKLSRYSATLALFSGECSLAHALERTSATLGKLSAHALSFALGPPSKRPRGRKRRKRGGVSY
jgi:hypothetical protein